MKILRIYNQHRRDCWVDVKCEGCGHTMTIKMAYDDRNYWDNVIPNRKCPQCNKSSSDLESKTEFIQTKYQPEQVV